MQQSPVAQVTPNGASRRKVVLIVVAVAAALLLYFSSLTVLSSMQLLDFGPSAGTISYAPDTLTEAQPITLATTQPISEAAWSPDGTVVALAGSGSTVSLRRIPGGEERATLDAGSPPTALFFSPDSQVVVAATGDDTINVWNVATGQPLYAPINAGVPLNNVMISSDGQRIYAAGRDGTLQVWQLVNGQRLLYRTGKLPALTDAAAWSEDGRVLAYADKGRGIVLWSLENDEETRVFDDSLPTARVVALTFSHLGGLVAAQDESGQIKVFQTQSGRHIQTFRWAGSDSASVSPVSASSFSADARLLALGGSDGRIELWDVQQGQLRATLDAAEGPVRGFGFTDDGSTMGAVNASGITRLWQPATISSS